jgi:DNA repair photolyase
MTGHIPGRGTSANPVGRFETQRLEACDDGWWQAEAPARPDTVVHAEIAKSIIARNESPDIPFDQSINPYRGCEHGCIYCYARPTHAYVNLSAGLDFETKLFFKANAAELLETELRKPRYRPQLINLGASTDPYQPIERKLGITRQILAVLAKFHHPVTIVTKGALVVRDIDLLAELAQEQLCYVMLSITTLEGDLKRTLEPRAPSAQARLRAMRELADVGIPVGVLVAPLIPALNDHELEAILQAARDAGARSAGYVPLRLPFEIKELFESWLHEHWPLKAQHVLSRIRAMRGGKLNDPRFGARFNGEGPFAALTAKRFALATARLGLARRQQYQLNCAAFCVPPVDTPQLSLFSG